MAKNKYAIAALIGLTLVLASCGVQDVENPNEDAPADASQSVQVGDVVSVEYTGTFPNGTVFDSSARQGQQLQVQVGAGRTIPGFEQALVGMDLNESKTITLPPEEAYGYYNESLIFEQEVPLENFGNETMTDYLGETITVTTATGQPLQALVLDVGTENVTLEIDPNPQLAGETLIFDVTVTDIERAPQNVPGPTQ